MLLTEAMASGCAVVGFDAGGGAEYLTDEISWPVPAGDIVGFVDRLEEVLTLWDTDRDAIERKTRSAIELVRQRYTLENEADDIVAALGPALERARNCDNTSTFDVHYRENRLRATARRLRSAGRAFRRR
jgi:glycosyltransferase involved in cell wall biosynthesis